MATEEEEKTWGAQLEEEGYIIEGTNLQNDAMVEAIYTLLEMTKDFPKQSQLRAFIKKQQEANYIFGCQFFQKDETYKVGDLNGHDNADQLPATPPDNILNSSTEAALQKLPPSPPRNGIRRADVQLDRTEVVNKIRERANPTVIVQSPPATGKTSLLDLTETALTSSKLGMKNRVIRFNVVGGDDQKLMNLLERKLGVEHTDGVSSLVSDDHHLWILIDDAQLAFKAESFWKVVVKDFEAIGSKNIHIVIAATYDLVSQGTTPYHFAEHPHILDLKLSSEEAETLCDGYACKIFFRQGLDGLQGHSAPVGGWPRWGFEWRHLHVASNLQRH